MIKIVKIAVIATCTIVLLSIGFYVLPENTQKIMESIVMGDKETIVCSVDGQLTGVFLTNSALQFVKTNIKEGDSISLIFRSIAYNYWYDPYYEFSHFQGKRKMAVFISTK